MTALVSPVAPGYVATLSLSYTSIGITKGTTLLWAGYAHPTNGSCSLASSVDGVNWDYTPQTGMIAGLGWSGQQPSLYDTLLIRSPTAIGNNLVCFVEKYKTSGVVSPSHFVVRYDGTTWSAIDGHQFISGSIAQRSTIIKAIGNIFFLLGSDGLFTSSDGTTWTKKADLPDEAPGGPVYYMKDIILVGSTYYVIYNAIYSVSPFNRTVFSSSTDLTNWNNLGEQISEAVDRIFSSGGEFYAETFSGLYKSSNFTTWTRIFGTSGRSSGYSFFSYGDGFWASVSRLDAGGGTDGLYYLPYSKSTITSTRLCSFDDAIVKNVRFFSYIDPILHNGFIFIGGPSGLYLFKYNSAWDDNDGVPPEVSFSAANDVAVTNYQTAVTIDVLANDAGAVTIIGVGRPAYGTAIASNGKITYTPTTDYYGSDSFVYTISDGTNTDQGTVSVTINAPGITDEIVMTAVPTAVNAIVGEEYTFTCAAVGGLTPYSWEIKSGGGTFPPSWLSINADSGVLSGTPGTNAAGTSQYLILYVSDISIPPKWKYSGTIPWSVEDAAPVYTAIIQGTLRLDTTTGDFAARKVYLYNYTTGDKVSETTSNATTGEWEFTQVAPGEYFVVGAAQGDDLNVPRDFDAMGVITVV